MTTNQEARQHVNWILCLILAGGLATGRTAFSQDAIDAAPSSVEQPADNALMDAATDAGIATAPEAETATEELAQPEASESVESAPVAEASATPSLDELLAQPAPEEAPAAPETAVLEEEVQEVVEPVAEAVVTEEAAETVEKSSLDALLAIPSSEEAAEVAEEAVVETLPVEILPETATTEEGVEDQPACAERLATQEIVKRQVRDEQGRRVFADAEAAFAAGKFKVAADKYDEAIKELPSRPENDTLLTQGKDRAATAYLKQAQLDYDRGNWEEAKNHALEAKTRNLQLSASADSLVRRCDRRSDRETRISKIPVNVADRPEVLAKQKQNEALFAEARRWYAIEEYDKSEALFESILIQDPTHRDAMRFLKKIAEKKLAARTTHLDATRVKMIQDVRKSWIPPLRQASSGPDAALTEGPNEAAPGQRALREKMQAILIPSIEFRQANVVDVITFLQQASVANDPGGSGVSFILKLGAGGTASPAAPTDASDPWATPSADGAEAPLGTASASTPSITLNLRRVSLLDAIKYITELASLRFRIEEYAVIIVPMNAVIDQMATRFYPVQPSIQELTIDQGESAEADFTQPEAGLASMGKSIVRKTNMQSFFEKMGVNFPPGSSITYNAAISQLIVNNTPENLDKLESILPDLNVIPSQVEIEARFVEINQQDMEEFGLEWLLTDAWQLASKSGSGPAMAQPRVQVNANNAGSGTLGFTKGLRFLTDTADDPQPLPRTSGTANSMLGGILSLSGVLTNPELNVVLHALDASGGADLLSAPRITTKSGNPAQIQVVKEILYPTEFEQQDIGSVEFTQVGVSDQVLRRPPIPSQFEKRGVGVILNATPTVGPDGYTIDLTLVPEVAELLEWVNYGPPGEYPIYQPIFASRNVTTSIVLWDGHTVVMGGLMKEDVSRMDDKIPMLGDIPVIGRLFGVKGEYSSKKNLMVFVTARLIDPAGQPIRSADEITTSGAESNKAGN
jgi:general secretion pathway protein D